MAFQFSLPALVSLEDRARYSTEGTMIQESDRRVKQEFPTKIEHDPIMISPVLSVRRIFSNPAVPQKYRSNFLHLYFDIGWFGILSGSAINFINVYAARLGATGFQIGLIGAVSAVMTLILAMPSSRWLERKQIDKTVFWNSIVYRLGYLLWIPLPWLFNEVGQVWALIMITLLMGIPLTALGVGFNALFAAAVPGEFRAYVAGIRNIVLSMTFILASLGSGYLLERLPFPAGYQVVFAIGAFGALMSSLHLYFIRSVSPPIHPGLQPMAGLPHPQRGLKDGLRLDVWKTPFGNILLVLFGFHLAQYLAIPIFPLYMVNELHLSDDQIGVGTALFYLTVMIGSTQLVRMIQKIGLKRVTGWGVAAMCLYPMILAASKNVYHFYLISTLGGFVWAMVGGSFANYLLEHIPEGDRPAYLAWYSIIANACILLGSLAGPLIAGFLGISLGLVVIAFLRLLSGLAILKWG